MVRGQRIGAARSGGGGLSAARRAVTQNFSGMKVCSAMGGRT